MLSPVETNEFTCKFDTFTVHIAKYSIDKTIKPLILSFVRRNIESRDVAQVLVHQESGTFDEQKLDIIVIIEDIENRVQKSKQTKKRTGSAVRLFLEYCGVDEERATCLVVAAATGNKFKFHLYSLLLISFFLAYSERGLIRSIEHRSK